MPCPLVRDHPSLPASKHAWLSPCAPPGKAGCAFSSALYKQWDQSMSPEIPASPKVCPLSPLSSGSGFKPAQIREQSRASWSPWKQSSHLCAQKLRGQETGGASQQDVETKPVGCRNQASKETPDTHPILAVSSQSQRAEGACPTGLYPHTRPRSWDGIWGFGCRRSVCRCNQHVN